MAGSDQLKGTLKGGRDNSRQMSTAGPKGWRGPDTHVADARRGRTPAYAGDVKRNERSMEQHQGGRSKMPIRWGVPHSTHPVEGAVLVPKKAAKRRDAVGGR
jgi:hypothetical protein